MYGDLSVEEQMKADIQANLAGESQMAHLEKVSSRLQEVDEPRAYALPAVGAQPGVGNQDGRKLRAKAWDQNPTARSILAAMEPTVEGVKPDVDAILQSMNRMPMSELVQECGCWALKETARKDPIPGDPTGWQAEIMRNGGIEMALLALNKHTKSFVVQYRGLQLLVCLTVRGVDRWAPHSATSKAPLDPRVVKAIRRGGGVRIGRDALFVHSLGRVHDQGDGRETRYIRSEVQEYAWRLMVACGEQDQYSCAELASYYPSTFDDLPEPELQRKTK